MQPPTPNDPAKNPFAGSPMTPEEQAEGLKQIFARHARRQRNALLFGLAIVVLLDVVACTVVYLLTSNAQRNLSHTQAYSAEIGGKSIKEASTYAMQARLAASKAEYMAEQVKKDREWFVGSKVDSLNALTNSSLDLSRAFLRDIRDVTTTNLQRIEAAVAAAQKSVNDDAAQRRAAWQKDIAANLKNATAALQKYDPLLKIDPDVAERIDASLRQLKQVIDILTMMKSQEESDIKNVQTDLKLLRENIHVLEARWALLSNIVTNLPTRVATPPAPAPTSPAPPATPPAPAK